MPSEERADHIAGSRQSHAVQERLVRVVNIHFERIPERPERIPERDSRGSPDVGTLIQNQLFALVCKGCRKGQKGQKKQKFQAFFALFVLFRHFLSPTIHWSPDFEHMYPDSERFAALTGASPRPYTPRFANARRFFTVGNKESFKIMPNHKSAEKRDRRTRAATPPTPPTAAVCALRSRSCAPRWMRVASMTRGRCTPKPSR